MNNTNNVPLWQKDTLLMPLLSSLTTFEACAINLYRTWTRCMDSEQGPVTGCCAATRIRFTQDREFLNLLMTVSVSQLILLRWVTLVILLIRALMCLN